MSLNSFRTRTTLTVGKEAVDIYSLPALERTFPGVRRLPFSLKILLENLLRREDDAFVHADDIRTLASWQPHAGTQKEISFMPARVLLQDFTGVPCVVDLAAMRDAIVELGGDPERVNPLPPVELVIDHSVQVDYFGRQDALQLNTRMEYQRNRERYAFLRWGQTAFRNFRVVPPETGIVHQVNIEHLARVVCRDTANGRPVAYPDTVFGTDSHTTMVNGLGVIGWGVGGIEAEAAMLGQPSSMLIPSVIGYRLTGHLPEGTTATDLVLTITESLRRKGVVGTFVEFYGPGLQHLTIADRATLGNMCPEYGATVAVFPIDDMTLEYLRFTGRDEAQVALVEAYARAQRLFRTDDAPEAEYTDTLSLDLSTVEPSLAGPRRPQDRVRLAAARTAFAAALPDLQKGLKKPAATGGASGGAATAVAEAVGAGLEHGSVVIAAITSCTNTSNPSVMIAAGLVAKRAVERGLTRKPWVKTSLAPGSKVVTEYLAKAGLQTYLDALGFNLVGYGCTTCIGNSGPLPDEVAAEVRERQLVVCSVLSGNRNFEGRIQQDVRANYLASPPLVVAYAIAGSLNVDLTTEPLGTGKDGRPVFLKDLWPSQREIQSTMGAALSAEMFRRQYASVFEGDELWRQLPVPEGDRFAWEEASTYIRRPSFLEHLTRNPPAAVPDHGSASARAARRQHHHRSHLAGGLDQGGQPGRDVPDRAGRVAEGLQLLRIAPRQSRGDGARHVCQRPAAQPARTRHRGWLDDAPARHRGHDDLRRGGEVRRGGRAAPRDCREGVRVRLLARLGRQGHAPARRAGRAGRELRADSSQQPRQHGRAAAPVRRRRVSGVARPDRPRGRRPDGHGRRARTPRVRDRARPRGGRDHA